LEPGEEGRLFHLLSAEMTEDAALEAIVTARKRAETGDLSAAITALSEGLRAVRNLDDPLETADIEIEILTASVETAFAMSTPYARDRALYELARVAHRDAQIERLEALVSAMIAAPGASGSRALMLADLSPFEDPELERWRQWARVAAAMTRWSPDLLE